MALTLHPLLARQLRRLALDSLTAPRDHEAWVQLLERVGRTYADADKDRYMMDRSQEISSREMADLNAALQVSQRRLAGLVSLSSDWIWEQDTQGRFTYFSNQVRDKPSVAPSELLGQCLIECDAIEVSPNVLTTLKASMSAREPFRDITLGVRAPEGQLRYVQISGEPVFDGDSFNGYVGVGSDVTRAVLEACQAQRLARYDGLTELPNRGMFMEELERALRRCRRGGGGFAVFFIDLDRFKNVNDTMGHAAGDQLLKEMASRLRPLLRDVDMLARLGGDEFVLLIEGCVNPVILTHMADSALAAIAQPLRLDEGGVQVSASIGIAIYPADGDDAASLLKSADAAMYLAKTRGRNNFRYYTSELAERSAKHFALESELRTAIDSGELRLHYQPKIDVVSGAIIGLEALVRWQHPQRGLLGPVEFIAIAEESGLIIPVGRWVANTACQQIRAWRKAGLETPSCAINVSARQFSNASLVDDIRQSLVAADLEASALEIEVTESVLMSDRTTAGRVLQGLHDSGIRIAIDDFGTGYSSLAYLKRFPAHTLKIDRSFVRDLPSDPDDAAITKAVIVMAHSLGMQVVAEGLESHDQLVFLREHRCDVVQGFLLGRPLSGEEIELRLPVVAAQATTPHVSSVH